MCDEKINLSILLPAYKEAANLKLLLPGIRESLKNVPFTYEILVVDALASTDDTKPVCAENGVKYFQRECGEFYGDAIRTGIACAEGDYLLIMDADGSHDPEYIPIMYKILQEKTDIVIGSRYTKGGHTDNGFMSRCMSKITNFIYRTAFKIDAADVSNSFRMYRTDILKEMKLTCNNFDIVEEILVKYIIHKRDAVIVETPVTFKTRNKGQSKRKLIPFIFSYIKTLFKLKNYQRLQELKARGYADPKEDENLNEVARLIKENSLPCETKESQTGNGCENVVQPDFKPSNFTADNECESTKLPERTSPTIPCEIKHGATGTGKKAITTKKRIVIAFVFVVLIIIADVAGFFIYSAVVPKLHGPVADMSGTTYIAVSKDNPHTENISVDKTDTQIIAVRIAFPRPKEYQEESEIDLEIFDSDGQLVGSDELSTFKLREMQFDVFVKIKSYKSLQIKISSDASAEAPVVLYAQDSDHISSQIQYEVKTLDFLSFFGIISFVTLPLLVMLLLWDFRRE